MAETSGARDDERAGTASRTAGGVAEPFVSPVTDEGSAGTAGTEVTGPTGRPTEVLDTPAVFIAGRVGLVGAEVEALEAALPEDPELSFRSPKTERRFLIVPNMPSLRVDPFEGDSVLGVGAAACFVLSTASEEEDFAVGAAATTGTTGAAAAGGATAGAGAPLG